MLVEFKAYLDYGGGDVSDWTSYCDLTDEEYCRLKEAYREDTSIYDAKGIQDIIDKATEEAIKQATQDLLEADSETYEEYIEEAIDDGNISSPEEWSADMLYSIWIEWPDEF